MRSVELYRPQLYKIEKVKKVETSTVKHFSVMFLIYPILFALLMNFQQINKFEKILRGAKSSNVTVSLDWLSVLFMDEQNSVPEPAGDDDVYSVNDRITLLYTGKGNEHYKHIYNVQYEGEHLATLLAHTRNRKLLAEGVVKLDIKNHLLYSIDLWKIYHDIEKSFSLKYKNISRVDIAIDGMNYLIDFMNLYMKQTAGQKAVSMVNRARFNANVLDQKTMQFQNFLVGSKKGIKKITIYNKSLDIVKTGKNYIQLFWKNNNVMEKLMPIEALAKEIKNKPDKCYIDGYKNIYRFEIRLKGESVKKVEGFSIDMLKSVEGMISIVKLMTCNFFEFRKNTSENLTRCEKLNIIPFQKFKIENLSKIPRQEREDLYKTRLSLHKNVRALFLGRMDTDNYAVYEMIKYDVLSFQLQKWFADKVTKEWVKKYGSQNPNKTQVNDVENFLLAIIEELQPDSNKTENFTPALATVEAKTEAIQQEYFKENNPYTFNPGSIEDAPF